jgi:transposase
MFRQAAMAMSVSLATAHRWWRRYQDALPAERHSLAWMADRSSRPARSPRLLDPSAQERICEARQRTGWGPRLVAGATGHPHSTVWKVLHPHGLSRRTKASRDAARRYEWPCPGDLLHMDTSATRGLSGQDTASRETARSAAASGWSRAKESAMTSLTRSSMTTRAWPTSSCTRTRRQRRSLGSLNGPWTGSSQKASAQSG